MKNNKNRLFLKIFKPNPEKVFVSLIPFLPVIPILTFVIAEYIIGTDGFIGSLFYATGLISYSFISIFAIPFEGFLELIGMMDFGGGIFHIGIKGASFLGIIIVQLIYSIIFYSIFSITSSLRGVRKMKYSFGRK